MTPADGIQHFIVFPGLALVGVKIGCYLLAPNTHKGRRVPFPDIKANPDYVPKEAGLFYKMIESLIAFARRRHPNFFKHTRSTNVSKESACESEFAGSLWICIIEDAVQDFNRECCEAYHEGIWFFVER